MRFSASTIVKICSVKECNDRARCKGLCNKHYKRFIKYGDVDYVKTFSVVSEKRCGKCGIIKPVEQFYARTEKSVRSKCKSCYAEQIRENKLLRQYGITLQEYNQLANKQRNLCALCENSQVYGSSSRYLAVDHCHKTGKIRGLLCNNCNRGLGLLGDDVSSIKKVLDYLS